MLRECERNVLPLCLSVRFTERVRYRLDVPTWRCDDRFRGPRRVIQCPDTATPTRISLGHTTAWNHDGYACYRTRHRAGNAAWVIPRVVVSLPPPLSGEKTELMEEKKFAKQHAYIHIHTHRHARARFCVHKCTHVYIFSSLSFSFTNLPHSSSPPPLSLSLSIFFSAINIRAFSIFSVSFQRTHHFVAW